MCGTGVGFSVERQFIANLPTINEDFYNVETMIQVHDSRIGWATALRQLIALLYAGQIPQWDLSKLRPKGARLKTFGGRASGPEPLNDLFIFCVDVFKRAAGRRLNSVECHDIVCKIADIVVVGGVRRSALISLSNPSDDRMRNAKTGQWWISNPQRALANNSAAYTEKPEIEIFIKEWLALIESKCGERGIFNRVSAHKKAASTGRRRLENYQLGTNPCGEILLRSAGLCNLSEVVIRPEDTLDDLCKKVEIAAIIGTFQSLLTDFRYIRNIWKKNADDERLLGVSLTGIMDHPVLSRVSVESRVWLSTMKSAVIETNKDWAEKLGIDQSAACTCVKPSGCTTLDTEIRVSGGFTMSMRNIFRAAGYDEERLNHFAELAEKGLLSEEDRWLVKGRDGVRKVPMLSNLFVQDESNQDQLISGLYLNGFAPVYEIEFEDGNTYKFTGNHKLKLTSGEWKRVDELTEDDDIAVL